MEQKKTEKNTLSMLEYLKEQESLKKIEEFHGKRIELLKQNITPLLFSTKDRKIVIHLIPIDAFESQKHFDLSIYKDQHDIISPLGCKGEPYAQSYNFDGLIHYCLGFGSKCIAYVHLYTNGIVEAIDGYDLIHDNKLVYIFDIEKMIVDALREYLLFQKKMCLKTPIILYLALLGTKELKISYPPVHGQHGEFKSIDREDLIFPRLIISNFNAAPEKILKPYFDRIWNACGQPKSLHYHEDGVWKEV